MGQKVNPIGMRLGVNRTWESRWYAGKGEYAGLLHEDLKIRDTLMRDLRQAGVARVVIERPHKKCRVTIHSARPGVIIGKKGADIEKLKTKIAKMTSSEVVVNIVEVRKPEVDAQLVAESHCPAIGTSRRLPSRHEAGRSVGHAAWCARYSYQLRRPSGWRRDCAHRMVS